MSLLRACITSLFVLFVTAVYANTEKAIFIALSASDLPDSFASLRLEELTPTHPSLRKSLPVAFPTDQQPHGTESWYLLADLREGQRHEVRICWTAIQPTTFDLDVFSLTDIQRNSELSTNIFQYSESQTRTRRPISSDSPGNTLLMRVWSAADFYTTNRTLMQSPPSVDVDIILDPYIFNVFPKSLLPTAAYIICLAICSWYGSGIVWSKLRTTITSREKTHRE